MNKSDLTVRSFIIGTIGLLIITIASMYVALRMGALPWPTVFVTILSMAILKKFKNSSLREVNITHTIMSSGAMVAGGLAFTIPGLWIIDPAATISIFQLCVIAVVGAILGTVFTSILRELLIVENQLPYPMGIAAYNTLTVGQEGGKSGKKLFITMGLSTIFTALRDGFALIPQLFTVFKGTALLPAAHLWLSPMAMGIGAIIGPVLSLMWALGAIIGFYLIIPIGLKLNLFPDLATADSFRSSLGIGLMFGTGFGIIIKVLFDLVKGKNNIKINLDKNSMIKLGAVLALCIVALSALTSITILQSILLIFAVFVACYLSSTLTGQTGINPMEIFAILVVLFITLVSSLDINSSFLIAGLVAVSCGLAGDVMNDLKSGYLIKTKAKDQLIGEIFGAIIASVLSVYLLFLLKDTLGPFGTATLPAPQATAIASMINGLANNTSFMLGLVIGAILFIIKVPSATLGLGFYLPMHISLAMASGAILQIIATKIFGKKSTDENTPIISSGLLGGEAITGVVIALITIFR